MKNIYDVMVIGGGHAGVEACYAAWKIGVKTALVTMEANAIGRMSCNPAIGGVSKGQIVRDIDALGGLMGILSDKAGIQFRMLNLSKGPAVWGPRAQEDMYLYSKYACDALAQCSGLDIIEGQLDDINPLNEAKDSSAQSEIELTMENGDKYLTKNVIITGGTFLDAIMYTGFTKTSGGRVGEGTSSKLSRSLEKLNIKLRRLKTGTPSRLDMDSVDFSETEIQYGDETPVPFSFRTKHQLVNTATCWIIRTNEKTHDILRSGFHLSPLFKGVIKGLGPRYCPSIEDKVNRFPDRNSHQLFLEPEGLDCGRIYVNGFSSSLPADIQDKALRTLPGLANAKILQIGYAVEYDSIDANQLNAKLECKNIPGLFFAGQVNGTSGYEEAAGQGLLAGINAAHNVQEKEAFILGRADSYIGVMIDDLITVDIDEPYRMFTSRAEYRLFLRQDNAEKRLMEKGRKLGMVDDKEWNEFNLSQTKINSLENKLSSTKIRADEAKEFLEKINGQQLKGSIKALDFLKRPGIELDELLKLLNIEHDLNSRELLQLSAEHLYSGFYERQKKDIERQRKMEAFIMPEDFNYMQVETVSIEARQKLSKVKPMTMGQAQKVTGVRPVDISALIFWINHHSETSNS